MKLYFNNLAPKLNPSIKKLHTGYWAIEVPEKLVHYIIFKINNEKNQSKFFNGGGHKNVDRPMVKKYVNNIIKNDVDENWIKINNYQKTKLKLLENQDKQIECLNLKKRYFLQQFFDYR